MPLGPLDSGPGTSIAFFDPNVTTSRLRQEADRAENRVASGDEELETAAQGTVGTRAGAPQDLVTLSQNAVGAVGGGAQNETGNAAETQEEDENPAGGIGINPSGLGGHLDLRA